MSVGELKDALKLNVNEVAASDELCIRVGAQSEAIARHTVQVMGEREQLAEELSSELWSVLGNYWSLLADSLHPSSSRNASEDSLIDLALGLAKLERNLVAGLASHQASAIHHESAIRILIFNLTTFGRIEDQRFFTLHAIITQLLSNLVSPVSPYDGSGIAGDKLSIYLNGKREDDIIIRLLDSQDVKTNIATLHLINNLTRNSPERQKECLNTTGTRWLGKILGKMDDWLELEDGRFDLAVQIFTGFIDSGLHHDLILLLQDDTEPVTPSQTILYKLLDSHLSSSTRVNNPSSPHMFLVDSFKDYSRYALISLRSGQDDARLPKVFEALVLVCEGLCSMGLAVQARRDKGKGRETEKGGDEDVVKAMKNEREGLIEPLIGLLAQLNHFIPRVKPGTTPTNALSPEQAAPVTLLKRLTVQLLGILTFDDTSVGDQVRQQGGVELVLGLTEVDESNPYLREHALLTVRNLMMHNPANQAIIAQMDPIGVQSETGEVLPLPEKMRKKQ